MAYYKSVENSVIYSMKNFKDLASILYELYRPLKKIVKNENQRGRNEPRQNECYFKVRQDKVTTPISTPTKIQRSKF